MKWKFHVLFCREVRDFSLSYLTEERLEIQSIADDISSKYVPPHVNIFYCLGGLTFTCFIIQVATGFAMVRNVIKLGYWRYWNTLPDIDFRKPNVWIYHKNLLLKFYYAKAGKWSSRYGEWVRLIFYVISK